MNIVFGRLIMKISFKDKTDVIFDFINISLLVLITLAVLYPLYFIVIASFSEPDAINTGKVLLFLLGSTQQVTSVFLRKPQYGMLIKIQFFIQSLEQQLI